MEMEIHSMPSPNQDDADADVNFDVDADADVAFNTDDDADFDTDDDDNDNANTAYNVNVSINPTVVALEAAEEFIVKMDNAFAEFDQDAHFDLKGVAASTSAITGLSATTGGVAADKSNGKEKEEDAEPSSFVDGAAVGLEEEYSLPLPEMNGIGDHANMKMNMNMNMNMNMSPIAQALDEINECEETNYDHGNNLNHEHEHEHDSNNDDIHQHLSVASLSPSALSSSSSSPSSASSASSSSSSSSPLQWQNNSTFSSYNGDFESEILSPNRELDVVQEEPEEEEEYDDVQDDTEDDTEEEKEIEEAPQQQQQQKQQQQQQEEQEQGEVQVDTDWGDDNDFFVFTDDEESDEDESLLVSPQPQPVPKMNMNMNTNMNTNMKQATNNEPPLLPLPQDQPVGQCSSMNGVGNDHGSDNNNNHDNDMGISYKANNKEEAVADDGNDDDNHAHTHTNTNTNPDLKQHSHTGDSLPVIYDDIDNNDNGNNGNNESILHNGSIKTSNLFSSSNETSETTPSSSSNDDNSPKSNNQASSSTSTSPPFTSTSTSTTTTTTTFTSPPPSSCAKTLTYMYLNQSKTDRMAESHAEDVLSLTLEVQTLRDQLKKEREAHEVTKAYLEQEEEKSVRAEVDVQQLRVDIESMKDGHGKEMEEVRVESELLKEKLQAAEEDYQQALNIAQDSDAQRVEMENHLKNALDEVENLRVQLVQAQSQSHQQLPIISEQQDRVGPECSSDGSAVYGTPQRMLGMGGVNGNGNSNGGRMMPSISSNSPYRRDKAIVTIGRNLLRQVAETDDLSTTSASSYDGSTTSNSSYLVTLTRRSAEKRQRLRDSMSRNSSSSDGGPVTGREVVCFSSPTSQNGGLDLGYGSAFISTVKAVSKIMKNSGKRLNLGGRWFNSSQSSISMKRKGKNMGMGGSGSRRSSSSTDSDEMDLESIARNYCRSVEALVSKQRKDVQELQQFCGFLEQKLEAV